MNSNSSSLLTHHQAHYDNDGNKNFSEVDCCMSISSKHRHLLFYFKLSIRWNRMPTSTNLPHLSIQREYVGFVVCCCCCSCCYTSLLSNIVVPMETCTAYCNGNLATFGSRSSYRHCVQGSSVCPQGQDKVNPSGHQFMLFSIACSTVAQRRGARRSPPADAWSTQRRARRGHER